MTFVSKSAIMRAMAVQDRASTSPAAQKMYRCHKGHHYFAFNAPPGTLCDCGTKVRIYEPCVTCGQRTATTRDNTVLMEDYS